MTKGKAGGMSSLPIVCQVGFSGSRELFDVGSLGQARVDALEAQVQVQLAARLRQIPRLLHLGHEPVFMCGLSQLAIGADMVFCRACKDAGLLQRILLPQPLEQFLAATSSAGTPDFTEMQRQAVGELARLDHVIEVRVASQSAERHDRFQDVVLALLEESDVVVCLSRADAPAGKPGGTEDFIRRAQVLGVPLLRLSVSIVDDQAVVTVAESLKSPTPTSRIGLPPHLPLQAIAAEASADAPALPHITSYLSAVKDQASRVAGRFKRIFSSGAGGVIVTHVIATVLAASSAAILLVERTDRLWLCGLLGAELALLLVDSTLHFLLHFTDMARRWAEARTVAEMSRSLMAADAAGASLAYAIRLTWDDVFSSLLRSCIVLQLYTRRLFGAGGNTAWRARLDQYCSLRLDTQILFYQRSASQARRTRKCCNWAFRLCTVIAILASANELLGRVTEKAVTLGGDPLAALGGLLAITFPVVAAAALSWATTNDLEARQSTFTQMSVFLARQRKRLEISENEREFIDLVLESETRLLSENIHWFERRCFIGVD